MSALSWALAGALSAYTAVLLYPTLGFGASGSFGPGLLVRALAAAVIARMSSLPVAFGAGLAVGVIEQELPTSGFLPLMPLTGSHLELIEAEIAQGTPAVGKTVRSLKLPEGALVGGIVRGGKVLPAVGDAVLAVGDRVIIFSPTAAESEVRQVLTA